MTGRRYAYADPPYPGQARKLYGAEAAAGRVAIEVNHLLLIGHLLDEYPDGWALSTSTPALRQVLNLCHDQGIPDADIRVGSWCKPFAVYKPGVPVAYTWEPVIFHGAAAHLVIAPNRPSATTWSCPTTPPPCPPTSRSSVAWWAPSPPGSPGGSAPSSGSCPVTRSTTCSQGPARSAALDDILGTRPPEPGTLFADHA